MNFFSSDAFLSSVAKVGFGGRAYANRAMFTRAMTPKPLGTATPALESFHNAQRGRYALATLPYRVDNQKMPVMRIVDLRQEAIRQKKQHVLSRKLYDAISAYDLE